MSKPVKLAKSTQAMRDDKQWPYLQVTYLDRVGDCAVANQYGVHCSPDQETPGLMIQINGDPSNRVILPLSAFNRNKELVESEVEVGNFTKSTYVKFDKDGNLNVKVSKNKTVDIEGNATVNCKGIIQVNVDGNAEVNVGGSSSVNVDGNSDVNVDGNSDVNVGGKATLTAIGEAEINASKLTINCTTDINGVLNVSQNANVSATVNAQAVVAVGGVSGAIVTANGVSLETHRHAAGTYTAGGDPVTGQSGAPA